MLVKWQALRMFIEFLELAIEPVREMVVDLFDRFADLPAARGGSAATGLEGNCQSNPLVERPGYQRRLAIARMADHGDSFGVDARVGYQVIDHPRYSPRPGGNGAPVI